MKCRIHENCEVPKDDKPAVMLIDVHTAFCLVHLLRKIEQPPEYVLDSIVSLEHALYAFNIPPSGGGTRLKELAA